jgi:hypothetical protein
LSVGSAATASGDDGGSVGDADRQFDVLDPRLEVRVSDLELERQVMDALNMDPLRVHDFLRFKAATTQLSGDIGVSAIYRNTLANMSRIG